METFETIVGILMLSAFASMCIVGVVHVIVCAVKEYNSTNP